jgi:site-specific DNA-methyltransferase (cytosine-N4-specific)
MSSTGATRGRRTRPRTVRPPFEKLRNLDADLPLIQAGDAYDILAHFPPSSVDCVVTSPPYWGLRTYGLDHHDVLTKWRSRYDYESRVGIRQASGLIPSAPSYEWYREHGGILGMEPYPDWFIVHLVEMFERLRPSLKPSANVWINLGDTYFARWSSIRAQGRQGLSEGERTRRRTPSSGWLHDKQLLMIPARFAIAMQNAGWILRNDLIWHKPDALPRPVADRLRLTHEHFFHFVQRTKGGRPAYYYDSAGAEIGVADVVSVRTGNSRDGHSAVLPAALVSPRIISSCPPRGLVLDPFCGTGSVVEVAVKLGRRAVGIEISGDYADAAREHATVAYRSRDQSAIHNSQGAAATASARISQNSSAVSEM